MPRRLSTRRSYDAWLNNHILPRWGNCLLADLQAAPWNYGSGPCPSPKSQVHVRSLSHALWDYAMWRGDAHAAQSQGTGHDHRGNPANSQTAQFDGGRIPTVLSNIWKVRRGRSPSNPLIKLVLEKGRIAMSDRTGCYRSQNAINVSDRKDGYRS